MNKDDLIPSEPGLLPYPHTIGAPAFKPNEMGVIIRNSVVSMNEQIEMQKNQISEQLELLKKQYLELEERKRISYLVYSSQMSFKPNPGFVYHLYERENSSRFLSLIEPEYWKRKDIKYVASVKLLHDLTWGVEGKSELFNNDFLSVSPQVLDK